MSHFLPSTREFHANQTAINGFLNPAAAALWNLRWQVAGYVAVNPSASHGELMGRFAPEAA